MSRFSDVFFFTAFFGKNLKEKKAKQLPKTDIQYFFAVSFLQLSVGRVEAKECMHAMKLLGTKKERKKKRKIANSIREKELYENLQLFREKL